MDKNIKISGLRISSICSPIEFIGKDSDGRDVLIHLRSKFSISFDGVPFVNMTIKHNLEEKDDVIAMQRLAEELGLVFPSSSSLIDIYDAHLKQGSHELDQLEELEY